MTATSRIAFLVIALLITVGAFVVLGGDDDSGTGATTAGTTPEATPEAPATTEDATPEPEPGKRSTPPMQTIRVRDGAAVGGVAEIEVARGERIRFRVDSDVADHVHVHGFDIMRDVGPGQTARFSFPAGIEGVFEVELEDRAVAIAELTVTPG